MNQSNLSAEVNPIKFEKLKVALTNALEDRGLKLNPEANLSIELIIEPKDKLKLSKYPRRSPYFYGYDTWNMNELETTEQFILRVNIKDISADKIVWTGLTKWRKSSSKDPLTQEYLQFIVDSILQAN
jgi:wyosine [tRNA(Phe)-imidazoG37] synthetase (radical SAM superfamily)